MKEGKIFFKKSNTRILLGKFVRKNNPSNSKRRILPSEGKNHQSIISIAENKKFLSQLIVDV